MNGLETSKLSKRDKKLIVVSRVISFFLLPFLFFLSCGRFSDDYELGAEFILTPGELLVAAGDSGFFNSFAQDKKGGIHIVYYQIPKRTIIWSYSPSLKQGFIKDEVIDEGGLNDDFGLSSKILVDSQNIPHVIYIRHIENGEPTFSMYHAYRVEENKWIKHKISIPCPFEARAELLDAVIDPEDTIHIAYIGIDKRLYFLSMSRDGKVISCEQIDPAVGEVARVPKGGAISNCVDIVMDEGGNFHVAYYDSENGNTKYASKKKGENIWFISVVGWEKIFQEEIKFTRGAPGEYIAELKYPSNESKLDSSLIAVGPGGKKEVPKEFWRFKSQKFVVLDGSIVGPGKELNLNTMRFFISYVRTDTSPDDDGMFCAVSYNELLEPSIAYYNSTKIRIEYAELKGGAVWEKQVVDESPVGSNMYFLRFKYNGNVFPSIVYFDSLMWDVKVAIKNGNQWIRNTLVSRGSAGAHLFSEFLPSYGRGGISYIRVLEDGSYALYFSVFNLPEDIFKGGAPPAGN